MQTSLVVSWLFQINVLTTWQTSSTQQSTVTQSHDETLQLDSDLELAMLRAPVTYAIVNITNFITTLSEVNDIRLATEGLAHGQLSPLIIPPSQ